MGSTRSYGAEVVLVPGVFDDAYKHASKLAEERGYTFVHPFEDERIIAGQATVGLEILDQLKNTDAVIVPIGGGGLIAGIAYVIKAILPECKVYGVQAAGAPGMLACRLAGEVCSFESVGTIADGIAIKRPGQIAFEYCERYVDDIVTVTEEEISTTMLFLMESNKTVAEGAGAASVAAAMFHKVNIKNKKAVCVVSGGNIDVNIISRVITQGLVKTGRITEFCSTIEDLPHRLADLLNIIGEYGANIISIDHIRHDRRAGLEAAVVRCVLETKNTKHGEALLEAVRDVGYDIVD